MTPFPFVVGCPRSGTTLLRAMLDSHPDLAIPGESYFVVELAPTFTRRFHRFDLAAYADAVTAHERFRKWGLPERALRAALDRRRPTDYASAVRATFAAYAEHEGKSRYGDKTPYYVLDLRLLGPLFPDGRFLHVIRDGHDVALSALSMPWGPTTPTKAGRYWRRHVEAGRRAGSRLGDRYRELRYETLVADPERALRAVCDFFALPYAPEMLAYPDRFDDLTASNVQPEIHEHLRQPPTGGLRSWRDQMPVDDVAAFEREAADLLAELGYETLTRRR